MSRILPCTRIPEDDFDQLAAMFEAEEELEYLMADTEPDENES